MSTRILAILAALALGCISLFFGVGAFVLWQARAIPLHLNGVLTRAEGVESKINASAVNLDKATKTWADSEQKIQTDVADTLLEARGTLSGAQDAFGSISPVAQRLQGTADAATGLLASARGTTDQLPADLTRITADIDAMQAPIASINRDALDVDSLLKDEALHQTIVNVDLTTASMAGVTNDFQKRFHDMLYPPPCKTFGCKLARAWPILRDVPALGEAGYWSEQLIRGSKP